MKRLVPVMLALCLLLSGCATLFDGRYTHVEPHKIQDGQQGEENISAYNYDGLCRALISLAESGAQSGIISVPEYDQNQLRWDIDRAVQHTMQTSPIAAWAVENISCEMGASGGQSAVAVSITYIHDRVEINKIRKVGNLENARGAIAGVLDECGTGVVLLLQNYAETDFAQMVEDHANNSPQTVMETPQTVVNIYPQEGTTRLVELKFTYQTSRDTLRSMQTQVRSVFDSATIFVSGYSTEAEKYERLYSFLMDFLVEGNLQLKTSITPAYSLLRHGVGNERAFATVYAAMCREAGLQCHVIGGTYQGNPRYWNMVCINGVYSHLDLLRCNLEGKFQTFADGQMNDYYWDYDIFPAGR